MKFLARLLLLFAIVVSGRAQAQAMRDGAGVARPLPRPAIILFWAAWCAPCRAEIRMIAQLNQAAAPTPVIVVPMDDGRRTREALAGVSPEQLRYVRSNPYALLRGLAGDMTGLPISIALDHAGTPCAVKQGAVTIGDIHAWVFKCS